MCRSIWRGQDVPGERVDGEAEGGENKSCARVNSDEKTVLQTEITRYAKTRPLRDGMQQRSQRDAGGKKMPRWRDAWTRQNQWPAAAGTVRYSELQ